jgi:virginiamycin B lyase
MSVVVATSMRVTAVAGRQRRLTALVLTLAGCVLAGAVVGPVQAARANAITYYTAAGMNEPSAIVAGPDGALWFINSGGIGSIGRITTSGAITNYTDPSISAPTAIAVGSDGALWFTNLGNNSIGRITTTGIITNYTGSGIVSPEGIAAGPDGALWFTSGENGDGSIGRITTDGSVTNYPIPGFSAPVGIAAGPDGSMWFTDPDFQNNSIGRITMSGAITNYTDPSLNNPNQIAAGPDGALWFTNSGGIGSPSNSIGRISTSGTITNYTDPSIHSPVAIAAGPDGAMWFTTTGVPFSSVERINGAGVVTNYPDPQYDGPEGIASGPDGAIWFSNTFRDSIGRMEIASYAGAVSSTPGLLAYWRLSERSGTTAVDERTAFNGSYIGGHTLGVPGALTGDANTAVALDGTTGQIRLPSLGTATHWTVEGWTHLNAQNGNNTLYGAQAGVRLMIRPAGVYADDRTSGQGKTVLQKTTPSNVGAWVYWALVRDGSTLTAYRNAVAVGSVTVKNPKVASALNGAIGASGSTNYLDGDVDEVAVYNSALIPQAFVTHYRFAGYSVGSCAGREATIARGAGADRLSGTRGRDVIVSGSGNDRISARSGNDVVCAGPNNDVLYGGPGNDLLYGGSGNDRLFGGSGNDRLYGGPGNDRINPGPGRDHVFAGPGNDRIFSRDGRRDVIDCGPGHDIAIVDRIDRTRRCETVIRTPRRR